MNANTHSQGSHVEYGYAGYDMRMTAFTKLKRISSIIRGALRSKEAMAEQVELNVHLAYDEDAKVWYVAKSDIPGLSLEAESPTDLVERIVAAAPELIEMNEALIQSATQERQDEPSFDMPGMRVARRPTHKTLRPVFDTPLELAFAR